MSAPGRKHQIAGKARGQAVGLLPFGLRLAGDHNVCIACAGAKSGDRVAVPPAPFAFDRTVAGRCGAENCFGSLQRGGAAAGFDLNYRRACFGKGVGRHEGRHRHIKTHQVGVEPLGHFKCKREALFTTRGVVQVKQDRLVAHQRPLGRGLVCAQCPSAGNRLF